MRALFLRHGESAHNAHTGGEPLSAEIGDLLTDRGREQAADAGAALRDLGVTHLYTSPMHRALETADAVGEAIGLEPETLPYVFEHHGEETFEDVVKRVWTLKDELEASHEADRPLIVTHGIFIRFFLLDSILGERFEPAVLDGLWNLGSSNCGLTVFAHAEDREPGGAPIAEGWTCLSWMERPWDRP